MRVDPVLFGNPARSGARRQRIAVRVRTLVLSIVCGLLPGATLAQSSWAQSSDLFAAGGTGAPEKPQINAALIPTADHVVLVLASQRGFFKAEGLDVNLRVISPAAAVASLLSGDLDVTTVTWIQLLTATARNIDLKVVTETDRGRPGYTSFVAKAGSDIKSPADLMAKKVAVVVTNGTCDLLLNDYLAKNNIDYKSIRYATLGIPDMVPTLLREGIDAACLPEPLLSTTRKQGVIREIHDLFSGDYADWPITTYTVSAAFAARNPNTVGALRRAIEKSLKILNENPDEARALIPSYTPIPADVAKDIVLPLYPAKSDPQVAVRVADLLRRSNLLGAK
jgi:NitT/TauT family transport system substrate-binding protein